MRMKVSQANRGQAFEDLLNFTNLQYEKAGIALIHKRPTPMKPLRRQGFHFLATFEKKSTVDYDGVYRGRAIYFEAKSTREETRFPLDNIERHQIEHLEKAEKQGAVCFFLIEFAKSHEVFFVPLATIGTTCCMHRTAAGKVSRGRTLTTTPTPWRKPNGQS